MSRMLLAFSALVLAVLTGCASVPEYSGGAGSGGGYGHQVLPGSNARTAGAIGGGAIGSLVFPRSPVVGAILGGVAGAVFGGQFDDRANAIGRTNCSANYTGTVSPSGVPTANTSPYHCSFSNSVQGNYNTPPPARRQ